MQFETTVMSRNFLQHALSSLSFMQSINFMSLDIPGLFFAISSGSVGPASATEVAMRAQSASGSSSISSTDINGSETSKLSLS